MNHTMAPMPTGQPSAGSRESSFSIRMTSGSVRFRDQPLQCPAQPALGDPPVTGRTAVDQQAGREHHARPRGEHAALIASYVDLGDLERMVFADPGEHLLAVLAVRAVRLGQQRDHGHDGCSPALMSAHRVAVGTTLVYFCRPPY